MRTGNERCTPDKAVDPCRYRPPVAVLLGLGSGGIADGTWPDYRLMGLGEDDVPQLLRLALDPRLHLTDGDDPAVYAPVHACAALGEFGATTALPLLEELPRLFADDWLQRSLLVLATGIGPPSIPALRAMLEDTVAGGDARTFAAEALEAVALGHPTARAAAVAALASVLDRTEGFDREVNSVAASKLIHLRAVEARPRIARAFAAGRIATDAAGIPPTAGAPSGDAQRIAGVGRRRLGTR